MTGHNATRIVSVLLMVIGVALVAQTLFYSGGLAFNVGYLMGFGLVLLGLLRLRLENRRRD